MPWATACSIERRLLAGVDRAEDDAVGLERDGLRHRRGAGRGRALAVEQAELPADRLGRLLGAFADAVGAAVALVVRDVDDQLVGLGLRAGGRAGPFGHRRGDRLDVGLRLVHESVLRARAADARAQDRGGGQEQPRWSHEFLIAHFLPLLLLASHDARQAGSPALNDGSRAADQAAAAPDAARRQFLIPARLVPATASRPPGGAARRRRARWRRPGSFR